MTERADDDLDRRLLDAAIEDDDPADRSLTDADQLLMQRIRSSTETYEGSRSRRPAQRHLLRVAAAVVLIAGLAVIPFLLPHPAPAFAATPPMLTVTPVPGSAAEILRQAAGSLPPAETAAELKFHTWVLESTDTGEGELSSVVQPYVITHTVAGDGSVTVTWRTGEPWPAKSAGAQPAGTVISLDEYGPGEYQWAFPQPPTAAEAYGPYLTEYAFLPAQPTAGDYLQGVQMLLAERSLSTGQLTALLDFLAGLPDLTVAGAVTDRLGRAGVLIETTSRQPEQFLDRIIVSTSGEGVLSAETVYVGHSRTDISSPAVIAYYAWLS